MIGLLFVVGYYMMIFRPFRGVRAPTGRGFATPFINLPPLQVLDGVFFGLFSVMSIFYLLSLTSYRGGHHPADIDVLFTTPVSPRHVLAFRMLRDSLLGLFLPLIMLVLSWRSSSQAWAQMVRDIDPVAANNSMRLITVSYCLMGMGWVALGYAATLWTNRPGEQYDRLRRLMGWALAAFICGTCFWVYRMLIQDFEGKGIIATLHNPWLRGMFFLPDAAVKFTLGPVSGNASAALVGLAVLLGFIALCVWLAMKQADWLFEIAAQRVNQTVQNARMMRSGDGYGMAAQRVRTAKTRAMRLGSLGRITVKGPWALVWKDLINSLRGFSLMMLLIPLVGVAAVIMATRIPNDPDTPAGIVSVMMIALMSFTNTSIAASSGFVDLLNRVDMLKPLPYSPGKTMFFEVIGKSLPGMFAAVLMTAIAMLFMPLQWSFVLSGGLLGVGAAAVASVCIGLATVLFPDVEDPSQRGLRGLVQLLVFAIFAVPPMGIFLGLLFGARWPPLAAATPAFLIALVVALVGANVAGHLFASFNPNE